MGKAPSVDRTRLPVCPNLKTSLVNSAKRFCKAACLCGSVDWCSEDVHPVLKLDLFQLTALDDLQEQFQDIEECFSRGVELLNTQTKNEGPPVVRIPPRQMSSYL